MAHKKFNMKDAKALQDRVSRSASQLLSTLETQYDTPFEAIATLMFATAGLAKAMDMPMDSLVEGVEAAYKSVEIMDNGESNATH